MYIMLFSIFFTSKKLSYKMGVVKQINIKNRTYYFYNDIINLKKFESKLLKIKKEIIQKHWYLQHWIYSN